MLITPIPSNMQVGPGAEVTSDVFSVCERIKEIDPRLVIRCHDGHEKPFVVSETGADGVERFVARYGELDARILEDLRYMLAVPFEDRLRRLEKDIDASNAQLGKMGGEKFERFAWDMQKSLVESGISDPMHFRSFRPRKVPG